MSKKKQWSNRELFFGSGMINYMVEHHQVDHIIAALITSKYIKDIDVEDATVQHLGPDYFAIQVLMAEKIIPYRAI